MASMHTGETGDGAQLLATERIVHIARIREGNEADVRRLVQKRFPHEAFEGTGVEAVTLFVGSTYVITEYEFNREYTPTFTALHNNTTINGFMEELGRMLDDEPVPLPDAAAVQLLASQALRWQRGREVEHTPHVRPKEASDDRV